MAKGIAILIQILIGGLGAITVSSVVPMELKGYFAFAITCLGVTQGYLPAVGGPHAPAAPTTPIDPQSGAQRGALRVGLAAALVAWLVLAAVIALASLAGCGAAGIQQARLGIAGAERAGAAAIRSFETYDEERQVDLALAERDKARNAKDDMDRAAIQIEARGLLANYREARRKVLVAAASFNAALAVAHAAVTASDLGLRVDFAVAILKVLAAVSDLQCAVEGLVSPSSTAAPPAPVPPHLPTTALPTRHENAPVPRALSHVPWYDLQNGGVSW